MECWKLRQRTEFGNGRGGSDDCGSSHMPAISEMCFGRCTRRILALPLPPPFRTSLSLLLLLFFPSRLSIEHQICIFFCREDGSRRATFPCVKHHSRTGQSVHRGSRGRQTVAPSSIID